MLNVGAALAFTAATANLLLGTLHWLIARAPGWRVARIYAAIAFSAAAYSILNAVYCIEGLSDRVYLAAGRLSYLTGTIQCIVWLLYAYSGRKGSLRAVPRPVRWVAVSAVAAGLVFAATGWLIVPRVSPVQIAWAGVTYHYPLTTTVGDIYGFLLLALAAAANVRLIQRSRRGERLLRWQVCLFLAVFLSAIEEVLVASRVINFPSLFDGGLLLLVVPLSWQVIDRVINDSQRLRDLSDDLEAEVARRTDRLEASELHLKEAQSLANVASWELDAATGRIHWPEEALRVFGPARDAPLDLPALLKYAHPKDREKILEADRKVRLTTVPVEVEHRIVRPDGVVRFARSIAKAVRNDQGAVVRVVGATQDITDQIEAREALRRSEERLQNAERLAHLGNWDWDLKTNQVSWSAEIFRILGHLEGRAPRLEDSLQLVATQDRVRVEEWIANCLATKKGSSIEVQVRGPNEEPRTLIVISEVVVDEESRPMRLYGSCQDVTESRRAQNDAFAKQKLETVGTLAGGIAHDFNNLLGAVLAQADLAAMEIADGVLPAKELESIRHVAIRGSGIVRQLMIYAGQESAVSEPVDISRLVGDMETLLKVVISKHARLTTELARDLPPILAGPAQLRQVVMNLVTNASEAIGEHDGTIVIRTGHAADLASPRGGPSGCVKLEVSDTGGGISREALTKIFDPFYTTKSAGRGLGLSVVQRIVQGVGGTIQIESELSQGTTFRILMPLASEIPQPPRSAITHAGPNKLDRHTLLVVEDESSLRLSVANMLRKRGLCVFEAADGTEALTRIREHRDAIELVLLDVTLPGVPSREVLTEVRRMRENVKVIVTSAYGKNAVDASFPGMRIDTFLRKPYTISELISLLSQVLSE